MQKFISKFLRSLLFCAALGTITAVYNFLGLSIDLSMILAFYSLIAGGFIWIAHVVWQAVKAHPHLYKR